MKPQHTWIIFDCRPMKSAAHRVITEVEAGMMTAADAASELHRLAASLPDLDPDKYQAQVGKLLAMRMFDRARRLVDCIGDQTLQAWVRPALLTAWWAIKLAALAAFVWLIVWLAR